MKEDFEKQWSDALSDYSVPPPDDAWANIEARLDEKSKKRGLILWWTNPRFISGIAAALVLTLGYLFYSRLPEKHQGNAVLAEQNDKSSVKQPALKNAGEMPKSTDNQQTAGAENNTNLAITGNRILPNKKSIVTNILRNEEIKNTEPEIFAGKSKENIAMASTLLSEEISNGDPENDNMAVNKLDSKKARTYANRFVAKRNFLAYEMPEEETIARKSDKAGKVWLGLNSGAAPFNPNYSYSGFTGEALSSAKNDEAYQSIKDGNVQTSFLPSGTGNTGKYSQNNVMPENSFKNGQSFNFGLNIGKSFSKNFGIESGIRFLRANTSMNSNVFAIDPKNGNVSSYFQANYISSGNNNASFLTVLSLSETSRQYYNYVAVPMVLNYAVPLIKNLNIEALGGVSNDFFIKSRFESQATGESTLNASNSNYKFYNISGLGGARLNYKLSGNWGLSLGGMYQHALFSGIGQNTSLKFRPQSFGLNYGLKYQF